MKSKMPSGGNAKIQSSKSKIIKYQNAKETKYQMMGNPKSKIPNPKQYQNSNDQNPKLVLKIRNCFEF